MISNVLICALFMDTCILCVLVNFCFVYGDLNEVMCFVNVLKLLLVKYQFSNFLVILFLNI